MSSGVILGSGVEIGDDVVIGPHTVIANCTIGDRVVVGANCTIGMPGFGFAKDTDGRQWRFPHVARVVIDSDVEIGSNTCIDRGALVDTYIGKGSKIDNLVHISHNVHIGENVMVIANTMIAGSVRICDGAWVSPSSSILNQLEVGKDALVGLGAVVIRDVAAGCTVVGNPAKQIT